MKILNQSTTDVLIEFGSMYKILWSGQSYEFKMRPTYQKRATIYLLKEMMPVKTISHQDKAKVVILSDAEYSGSLVVEVNP